jgi:Cu(I)/Ag(I) efflux system membrane fusion protein
MRASVAAAALVLSVAAPQAAEVSPALVQPAIDIQVSLASDRMDGVTANARLLAAEADRLGAPATRIARAARQLGKTKRLEDARVAFGAVSEAIVSYMDAQELSPASGVRVAFCPMVRKPWLQQDGELRNPYHGSAMPTCGSFVK